MNENVNVDLFDDLKVGLFKCRVNRGRNFIEGSKAFMDIIGASPGSLEKKSLESLFASVKEKNYFFGELNKNKSVKLFHSKYLNGKASPVSLVISARVKGKGKDKFIEGFIQDLSGSKNNVRFTSGEVSGIQQILDSIPDAIYFKDTENRITRVNEFYAKGFNGDMGKIIGKTDFEFFPEDQARLMFEDDNYVLSTGRPIVGKVERTLLNNGTWNQVITTKVPLYDHEGRITGTMGITRDMTAHANVEQERYSTILKALTVLNKALEMRDPYTQSHARFVRDIAGCLGKELKYDEDKLLRLKIAAELHDLGKISVPLDILIKPGKLTSLEYSLIKEHTSRCFELMKDIDFPFPLARIVYQHHERLDGSGYPCGIKGRKILKDARILAVSDVLESMTTHRPYRAALGIKEALKELKTGRDSKYDAEVVDIALKLIRQNKGRPFWR